MRNIIRQITIVVTMLITCHLSLLMTACSESDDESSDYDNWQERNEAYCHARRQLAAAASAVGAL